MVNIAHMPVELEENTNTLKKEMKLKERGAASGDEKHHPAGRNDSTADRRKHRQTWRRGHRTFKLKCGEKKRSKRLNRTSPPWENPSALTCLELGDQRNEGRKGIY